MSTTVSAMNITDVGTVGVPVADQDRALAFYRDVLGFEVGIDAPFGAGSRWVRPGREPAVRRGAPNRRLTGR